MKQNNPLLELNLETAKKTVAALRKKLHAFNGAYYQQSAPLVDDVTYDVMLKQLKKLETRFPELLDEASPTQNVGSDLSGNFKKVTHHIPMLSISNVYNKDDLANWTDYIDRNLDHADSAYVCELKIDGLAVTIRYEDGKPVSAVTRGDGAVGEDVTKNIHAIRSLPKLLPKPIHFELRGEIYFPKSTFMAFNRRREQMGLPAYKNPRNAASGCMRMKDPSKVEQRGLDIFIYDIVAGEHGGSHFENLTDLKNLGIPTTPGTKKITSLNDILGFCREWETKKQHLDFDIDGVVIKIDRLNDRKFLGTRSKSPRWVVAWKFTTERTETKLLGIENSIGRTGVITPVALLQPVDLLGTVVKRATLHNYEHIAKLDIQTGDTLFIEKGGEIIPKVIAANVEKRVADAVSVKPPVECPTCRFPVESDTLIEIRCPNPQCPSKILGGLKHFVSRNALDIRHLGSAILEKLLGDGLIKTGADIFQLRKHLVAIQNREGFGEKSAANILNAVDGARTKPLDKFIYAFGIANIGEKGSKILSRHVKNLPNLLSVSKQSLETLPDFGDVMVQSVMDWVSTEDNRRLIHRLMADDINPVFVKQAYRDQKNETVVITGKLSKPRNEWKLLLENHGYRVSGAVSAKTGYLLAGDDAGSKRKKAEKLEIKIVTEAEMQKLLQS